MSGTTGPARTRTAFVDESQSNSARDPDTYILTAAICDSRALTAARQVIAALRAKGERKLHWRDEGGKRRQEIVEAIAGVPLQHIVVVRDGMPGERPERRRRHCLERLLYELDQLAVPVRNVSPAANRVMRRGSLPAARSECSRAAGRG